MFRSVGTQHLQVSEKNFDTPYTVGLKRHRVYDERLNQRDLSLRWYHGRCSRGWGVPPIQNSTGTSPRNRNFLNKIFWVITKIFTFSFFRGRNPRRNQNLVICKFDTAESVPLVKTSWRRPCTLPISFSGPYVYATYGRVQPILFTSFASFFYRKFFFWKHQHCS